MKFHTQRFLTVAAALMLATFSASDASAQASATAAAPPLSVVDLEDTNWKSPVDYAGVIAAERVVAQQIIGTPGIPYSQFALYTGYDRMLSYIQNDLSASLPLAPLVGSNFQKVMIEAPNDPVLKKMEAGKLDILRDQLTDKLAR